MLPRLLIVDDEPPILLAMRNYFGAKGYAVDCAREREEAEALLSAYPYACVILDLRMTPAHGGDGLEVLAHARMRRPASRIVILTAYGSPAAEAEARSRGADAFIRKPVPLPELARLVAALVGRAA
jgi:DNA-binding response OmpR family regulator